MGSWIAGLIGGAAGAYAGYSVGGGMLGLAVGGLLGSLLGGLAKEWISPSKPAAQANPLPAGGRLLRSPEVEAQVKQDVDAHMAKLAEKTKTEQARMQRLAEESRGVQIGAHPPQAAPVAASDGISR